MIHIEHINKNYMSTQVLFDFSVEIDNEGNKVYGLLGPNGAGKTTLIKVITGLLDYSSGKIIVDGESDYKTWCQNNVVLIPAGERGIRYKNTVFDNIMCFSAMKGGSEKRTRTLINEYSQMMNFTSFLKRRVETLSMGQKKKAMLLCGLCTDMKVIIMDEPSNGLDIDSQIEMKALVKQLSQQLHKTFIISSHDMEFLSDMAEHSIFIFEGRNVNEVNGIMNTEKIRKEYIETKERIKSVNEKIF